MTNNDIEGLTVPELLEMYSLTVEALKSKLGPRPDPTARVPDGAGIRILRVLRNRTVPMSAGDLAVATMGGGIWTRQSIYSTAHRMVGNGLIRRPRHGYYEAVK